MRNKTQIVGILNITPDSFSDGGKYFSLEKAIEQAEKLLNDGADIIDIGGQSTRPGYEEISLEEELNRVIPVIKAISSKYNCPISIDTYRAKVAEEALKNGASIINDIWGLQYDNGEMAQVVAKYNCPIIIMHNQTKKEYSDDIIDDIKNFFYKSFEICDKYGIKKENIIIDPGIGFAKGCEENLKILNRIDELTSFAPTLLGLSRKRFIGSVLNLEPLERVEGTLALNSIAIYKGVKYIRVHDVKEHFKALSIIDKLLEYKK